MLRKKGLTTFIMMALAIGACVMNSAQDADALAIYLNDVNTGVVTNIVDNGPGDADSRRGWIDYTGTVGGFSTWATVGTSNSDPGNPDLAIAKTSFYSLMLIGAGDLELGLTDTDFLLVSQPSPPPHILAAGIKGFAHDTVSLDQFVDRSNGAFGMSDIEIELGPLSAPSPGGPIGDNTTSAPFDMDGKPFSMTTVVTVGHDQYGTTSLVGVDASVTSTPEPTTILLVGTGLVGLAAFAARRRKKELS